SNLLKKKPRRSDRDFEVFVSVRRKLAAPAYHALHSPAHSHSRGAACGRTSAARSRPHRSISGRMLNGTSHNENRAFLCSDDSDDDVTEFTFRRARLVRRQRRIVAIERRAIRTHILDVLAHVAKDMRVVLWWAHPCT